MIPHTGHVARRVDDYLHDLLDDETAAHVARHCADCPACAAALEDARRRLAALQTVPPTEASEALVRATVAAVEEHEGRWRRRRRYVLGACAGVAAAAAAVIASVHLHYANLSASPTDLKVLGQTQWLAGADAALRVCLLDHQTGQAIVGTHVRIDLQNKAINKTVELAHFNTDAAGTGDPRFRVPDWGNADCELHVTAVGAPSESVSYPVKVRRSWQVMLSSDKPVYQPGQTIRVRSLALRRPDLRPVAGEDVTFTITDPKGNVIMKQAGKNSAYGIAAADCALADEITEGQYVIGCTVGDTASRLAVQVQKYVLPKFKVGLALDRPYYEPGQKITATVDVAYFFGKPAAGAVVELEARAAGPVKLLTQAAGKADENGRAVLAIDLPAAPAGPSDDDMSVRLTATVTDTAGQKITKQADTVVTTSPLKLALIPEDGELRPSLETTVYVFTSYADGQPAKATVELPDGRKVTTNELGVGSFVHAANRGMDLDGTFRVTDSNNVTSSRQLRLGAVRSADEAWAFFLRTDKAVYEAGDTLHLSAVGYADAPVFVDVIKDGQTWLTATIPFAAGKGSCDLDLPPELSGALELDAYRVDPNGMRAERRRTLFVRPATGLQVRATTDRAEYRPGGKARLDLTLLDQDGRPLRGAVSLAAVDEAVFSVVPQGPGSERRFFGAEPNFAPPEVAAKLPPAERRQVEQAWLARRQNAEVAVASSKAVRSGPARAMDEAAQPEPLAPGHLTLDASSFAVKARSVAQIRYLGLDRVKFFWSLWGLAVAVMVYVLVWVYVRPWYVVAILHGVGIILGCGGLLFLVMTDALPLGGVGAKMAESAGAMAPQQAGNKGSFGPDRVRQNFPETLLWRPELITDDDGHAHLDVDLADSITTWRLTASAVAADGRLGATQAGIKVFQPFFVDLNLPVSLTRGDEVAVPVVVYNYLDRPQTVDLTLAAGDWFECFDGAARKVQLAARAVHSVSYRLRVKAVGRHALQVTAKAGDVADAIKRDIEVVPDGRRVEQVANGSLGQPAELTLTVPENAIAGSAKAFVKIYPSSFSQLVEGLDGIFQMPYGCFEQTSSTTYPNVLALEYLQQTGRAAPEVKARAERYIHLGYQRLLGFEVAGGGFDWFGRAPANRTLTAYGLMEFQDMAKVHAVDPQLIERTRAWLLKQRNADGSWAPEGHGFAGDPGQGSARAQLRTTAYIAWAVLGAPGASSFADTTQRYLLSHRADAIDDPYPLALVANALSGPDALPYLDRLEALKQSDDDGKLCFWRQPAGERTAFHGAGRGGSVETTALAALALLHHERHPETTRRALAWLVKQKDANGTWPSTQATVLALKALVAGTGKPAGDRERRITLTWDGEKREIVIPQDQAEVLKQIDLSAGLKPGTHRLTLTETSGSAAGYQVAFRYHVPDAGGPKEFEALGLQLTYDRTEVSVDEAVRATATVVNRGKDGAPMVVVELPVPAGFVFEPGDLVGLVNAGTVEKYQQGARGVVVYLRGLRAGQSLDCRYLLRATTPVKVNVPPARAYEYYDPDRQATSAAARLTAAP